MLAAAALMALAVLSSLFVNDADAAPTISSATHDRNTPAADHSPMLARFVSGLKYRV